eukprot:jgi/Galph1/2679/GphlegSOOS_G1351.1
MTANSSKLPFSTKKNLTVTRSQPKKKFALSSLLAALGVSWLCLFGKSVHAAPTKTQLRIRQDYAATTAFIGVNSGRAFDREYLMSEEITKVPPADFLERCIDRDLQYMVGWTHFHEFRCIFVAAAFLVVFESITGFVDTFIQQQERKEVEDEMQRFGRFFSPKTEYRDDVSLDKVDINMWKSQQREVAFYSKEFPDQEVPTEGEDDEEDGSDSEHHDDGDTDHKSLEKLFKK